MHYRMEPPELRAYDRFPYMNPLYRNQNDYIMTVEGQGSVSVIPDQALLTIGVVTENSNVQTAQQENALKSNRLIEVLKQAGIAQDDIKTTVYSVNPRYDYVEGKSIFRGYEVEHSLQVTVKEIPKIGMIYDIAIKNGANQTGNLQFQNSHADFHYLQALTMAVHDAQQKAQQIAKTIGVTFNNVPLRITEERPQSIKPFFAASFEVKAQALPTPIQPGELTFTANVNAVFEYNKKNA